VARHEIAPSLKTKQLPQNSTNKPKHKMTLQELIDELRELRDQRGGDCTVKIEALLTSGKTILEPLACGADTSTGQTIINIVAE
jgi:Ni,Fe-hydrogenase maturation factor